MVKKFIIYTRCSTDDQASGDFTTLDAQAHHCKNMLEALGYESSRIVKDDGYSGKDLNRPGIQSILKNIGLPNQKRTFDGIVFLRLDRLTRNPRDLYALIDLFKQHNIDFISVRENLDSSSALGRVVIGILGLLASFERELTGERVRASGIARVRQGKWIGGRLPYGYKLINDGAPLPDGRQPHQIIVDKTTGSRLKFIWEMAAENKSLMAIARELEKRGIKSAQGNSWRKQSVLKMLRNPFYKGYVQWAGEVHKGKHPAIVEPALWARANKVIGANLPGHRFISKPKEYIYLLEGLIKCGKCGSHMITKYAKGHTGRKFYYYICGRKNQGLGCNEPRVSATAFDNAIIDYFRKASQDQKVIIRAIEEAVTASRKTLTAIDKDIRKTEKKLTSAREEAEKLLNLALRSVISKGNTYKARMEQIEAEIASLDDKLSKLQARKRASEMSADSGRFLHSNLVFAMSRLNQVPPQAQKNLFQALIKQIIVHEDHLEISMFIEQPLQEESSTVTKAKRKSPTSKSRASSIAAGKGLPQRQIWLPREDSATTFATSCCSLRSLPYVH